jgi:hypothetical protein
MFSEHVIYVDESGDHSLTSLDSNYPVFVLAFCLFRKDDYVRHVTPAIQDLKFRWWGHDTIVLHEREMYRKEPPFTFLGNPMIGGAFMSHLSRLIEEAPMTVIAAVIRKDRLVHRYGSPKNPYVLALLFCMERAREYLDDIAADPFGKTHLVCEARGAREDRELAEEFRQISTEGGILRRTPIRGFDIVFSHKRSNSPGLQLADLIARPIGLHVQNPEQLNRAFVVIAPKIWDLKVFP